MWLIMRVINVHHANSEFTILRLTRPSDLDFMQESGTDSMVVDQIFTMKYF